MSDHELELTRDAYAELRAASMDVLSTLPEFMGMPPLRHIQAVSNLRQALNNSPMKRGSFPGELMGLGGSDA